MCICREEGGAREELYARRRIRQNIEALEALLRRLCQEIEALSASYHQIASLQAEMNRIRAEIARLEARRVQFHQRAKFRCFLLSLLTLFLFFAHWLSR